MTEVNPTDPNIDLSPQIGYISEAESKKTFEHAEKCQLYNAINGLQNCFLRGLYQIVMDSNDKHCMKVYFSQERKEFYLMLIQLNQFETIYYFYSRFVVVLAIN